jgi:hypothetical protein
LQWPSDVGVKAALASQAELELHLGHAVAEKPYLAALGKTNLCVLWQ